MRNLNSYQQRFAVLITQKNNMKIRKNILIVDHTSDLERQVREPLQKQMEEVGIATLVVRAKDGAEAAIKSENQKFDMVIIDTEVPRLMDGGFVYGIKSYKNTQDAELFLVSEKEPKDLPENLRNSKVFRKPVNTQDLINAMIEVLNSEHSGSPSGPSSTTSSTSATKFSVDVRVVNAVIGATSKVLTQFGVQNLAMGKATAKSPHAPLLGEVSSVVDVKSKNFQGYICISFDKGSFLEVVSSMLMEEQTEINSENQDAVGEINNIVFGNAKAEITSFGVEMTVPRVLMGANNTIECPHGSAGMIIPFTTPKGNFYIVVIAIPPTI